MQIHTGTCSWSSEDWRGSFYPENLPHGEWLTFYSSHFSCIEVESTFYHMPSRHLTESWNQKTPDDFRFCIKMPRQITHELHLHQETSPVDHFLNCLEPLGSKLSVVLAQFPWSFHADQHHRDFFHFLENFPHDRVRLAVEFRHDSWYQPRFIQLCEKYNTSWVWYDTQPVGGSGPFMNHPKTCDLAYIRLLGDPRTQFSSDGEPRHHYRQVQWARDWELGLWCLKVERMHNLSESFIFCANHYEGFAPATVEKIRQRFQLPARTIAPEWTLQRHASDQQPDFWGTPPPNSPSL